MWVEDGGDKLTGVGKRNTSCLCVGGAMLSAHNRLAALSSILLLQSYKWTGKRRKSLCWRKVKRPGHPRVKIKKKDRGEKPEILKNLSSPRHRGLQRKIEINYGPCSSFFIVMESKEEEQKRFIMELEFIQALTNPSYLSFLAKNGHFDDPKLIAYLEYLLYWTTPKYSHLLTYPNALVVIKLLQGEDFRKELKNELFINHLHQQQFFQWTNTSR